MCSKVCKTTCMRASALGTSTPSRYFLRKRTIQRLGDSKSVSARNKCNYVAYTSHLAVLSLQTHGQVHQVRPLLAVAQLSGFGKDVKRSVGGSAADQSHASGRPSPNLPRPMYHPVLTYHDFWFCTTQKRGASLCSPQLSDQLSVSVAICYSVSNYQNIGKNPYQCNSGCFCLTTNKYGILLPSSTSSSAAVVHTAIYQGAHIGMPK